MQEGQWEAITECGNEEVTGTSQGTLISDSEVEWQGRLQRWGEWGSPAPLLFKIECKE